MPHRKATSPKVFLLPIHILSLISFWCSQVYAEDIEIYVTDKSSLQSNVLLLIDTSGSMQRLMEVDDGYGSEYSIIDFHTPYQGCISYTVTCTKSSVSNTSSDGGGSNNCTRTCAEYGNVLSRMEIVQDVASNLIATTSGINISLMRYDSEAEGGFVDLASQDVDTASAEFQSVINSYTPAGNTPLEETYYEAYRYFGGYTPLFGLTSQPEHSDASALNGGSYISPVVDSCQKNNIILFTDGLPTSDTSANDDIQALVTGKLDTDLTDLSATCSGDGECMNELAYYLSHTDLMSTIEGDQTVSTYAIGGFGLENSAVSLLENVAKYGNGLYYSADDAAGLSAALEKIIDNILAEEGTFSAPSVAVSAYNQLKHADEIYYALFSPQSGPRWPGNLKRYRLDTNGDLVDGNAAAAIDSTTGFFKSTSQSYWSSSADGESISNGGFAHQLSLNRNLYTFTADKASNTALNSTDHQLSETNSKITKSLLGIEDQSDAYLANLLAWSRGVDTEDADNDDVTAEARQQIGDPLHSAPVVVDYYHDKSSVDATLFFGTNEGFLHALSTATGQEEFAFIPPELLPNLDVYRTNDSAPFGSKVYGMDGPISVWTNDKNGNGNILNGDNGSAELGEFVYLFAGMRRGGKNLYALDVTDRTSPLLKWVVKGGEGDFVELAQTWSKPIPAKLKLNGVETTVLIFGGGYDTDQDNAATKTQDDTGRAIFIVDASTGERLWWSSNQAAANLTLADMNYSIPADITSVDINDDDLVDILFAADMGGQLWRIDIDNSNDGASHLATGGVIANISGTSATNGRRFYNRPDVSLTSKRGKSPYFSIAIGSGFREHPLNTTTIDRFYMIKDPNVYSVPTDYRYAASGDTVITESHLYDATDNLIESSESETASKAQTLLDAANGWYVTLPNIGEKSLSVSITYDSNILFSTFAPSGETTSQCGPDTGTGRIYAMNIENATPVVDMDNDTKMESRDRSYGLTKGGIPPTPSLISIAGAGTSPALCVGTECLDIALDLVPYQKAYWREN